MRSRGEVWRQRPWIWVPALVFFLANAAGFVVYRLGYAGRVESLEHTLEDQKRRLQELEDQKKGLQIQLTRVSTNERQVQQLYADRFAPRSQRVTKVQAEVRTLAGRAGLEPRAYSFPEDDLDKHGLIKRSFIFSVEGTYPELRQFLYLLEASRSFLTVEEINLAGNAGDDGSELRIDLSLSTLFARDAQESAGPPAAAPAQAQAQAPSEDGTGGAS